MFQLKTRLCRSVCGKALLFRKVPKTAGGSAASSAASREDIRLSAGAAELLRTPSGIAEVCRTHRRVYCEAFRRPSIEEGTTPELSRDD